MIPLTHPDILRDGPAIPKLSHDHPPLRIDERHCQYGIEATCPRCRRRVAPCTRSPISAEDVRQERYVCLPCRRRA